MAHNLLKAVLMLLSIVIVAWMATAALSPGLLIFFAVVGMLVTIPLVLVGRKLIDREPTVEQAQRVTTWMHFAFGIFVASALVAAVRYVAGHSQQMLPVPSWLGLGIMLAGSAVVLLVMGNLALKGRGAPFAVALTRLVAVEWFYAWTRNPMVLAGTVGLLGLGLYLRSGLFLLFVALFFVPVVIAFLTLFEERELEIRFGQDYLDYKARTPGYFPRRPV